MSSNPVYIALEALNSLAAADLVTLDHRLDDHIAYTNVSLPTLRGKTAVSQVFGLVARRWVAFDAHIKAIAADGPVVLSERIDAVTLGPFRFQFWVSGRFEIHGGKITVWRDYFDWYDVARGSLQAVAGAVIPRLRPRFPMDGVALTVSSAARPAPLEVVK